MKIFEHFDEIPAIKMQSNYYWIKMKGEETFMYFCLQNPSSFLKGEWQGYRIFYSQ